MSRCLSKDLAKIRKVHKTPQKCGLSGVVAARESVKCDTGVTALTHAIKSLTQARAGYVRSDLRSLTHGYAFCLWKGPRDALWFSGSRQMSASSGLVRILTGSCRADMKGHSLFHVWNASRHRGFQSRLGGAGQRPGEEWHTMQHSFISGLSPEVSAG
jgi:hypothetical protein